MGKVTLTITEAHNLKAADFGGTSDGYCTVKVFTGEGDKPTQQERTKTIPKKLAPQWAETFTLFLVDPTDRVVLEVWDEDKVSRDDFLGEVCLSGAELMSGQQTAWKPLKPKEGKPDPSIRGKLNLTWSQHE